MLFCYPYRYNCKIEKQGVSMKQVEDWNITVESFAFFPTVPLLFDEESWKGLWPIINKRPLEVREVMQKLQQEQKQNELKKKDEENQRRQQEESERLKAQKKAQLEARKRRTIIIGHFQYYLRHMEDGS